MEATTIRLTLPAELGAIVVSNPDVQSKLNTNDDVTVASIATPSDATGTFRDFGATAIAILGTVAAATAVKGVFDIIKTVIIESHKTYRHRLSQRHEMRKLVLSLGEMETTIDLDDRLEDIEAKLSELEAQAG